MAGALTTGDHNEVLLRIDDARKHVPTKDKPRAELNLATLGLELVPSELFVLKGLRTLHMRGNLLEYLPASINLLESLEILNVSENALRSLPETIGDFAHLKKLFLQRNKLKELPDTIGSLSLTLDELDVGTNRLEELPETLGDLELLERFDARDNRLEELPDSFTAKNLPALRIVNFEGNPAIERLPWSIKCIQDVYPVMMSADRRRQLVKRSLDIRRRVNERLVMCDLGDPAET